MLKAVQRQLKKVTSSHKGQIWYDFMSMRYLEEAKSQRQKAE